MVAKFDSVVNICFVFQVNFRYRTEEFPTRHFSDKQQIGWIADQVLTVVPELVEVDSEGFKSVAYARACALVAAAVKELHDETRQEFAAVWKELKKLSPST